MVIRSGAVLLLLGILASPARSEIEPSALPLALRTVNPDLLSGSRFAWLEAQGAFGPPPPPRARDAYPNLAKGRSPAVLDARIGPNVRLGDDAGDLPASQRGQAEAHLFRSTLDPDLLLATVQEGRYSASGGALNNGYAISRDGGLTWTRALVPGLTRISGGAFFRATDPVAAIGPQGDLYLNALVARDPAFDLGAVVLTRSLDGAATWSEPIVIFESPSSQLFPDKNWLAVNDFPGTRNPGRLVATWTNFTSTTSGAATGNHLAAAFSDDRGATWSPAINLTPPGSNNQGTQPVFLPDGSLGVIYVSFFSGNNAAQFSIDYKHSEDGGRTFPALASRVVPFVQGWDDPEIREGVFLPSATVARATGEIFVTYTAVVGGSPRVMMTKSADRGATWTTPLAVSDQPPGGSVMNPAISVTPDGGSVAIVYMDKRHAPGGRGFIDHTAALSFDGGSTWQPNVRLSEISSDLRYGPPTTRGVMVGDYLGIVPALAPDQPFVAVWCDTRTGDSDLYAVRFAGQPEASFESWRVARFSRAELQNSERSGPAADFDRDGYPNAAECLLQTDPRHAETGSAYVTIDDGAFFTIAYRFRALADLDPGTRWERSDDGITWSTLRAGISNLPPSLLLPQNNVGNLRDAISGRPPRFYRQVVANAPIQEILVSSSDGRLANVSSRARVVGDTSPLIAGFVLSGSKTILVRAAGPALRSTGVADAISDPRLVLTDGAGFTRENDNWQAATAPGVFAQVGAFPFSAGSRDAALALTLPAQGYTVSVTAGDSTAGVALVEVYDAEPAAAFSRDARLINLSTRAEVGSGSNALIAGFVLTGTVPRRVLLRAVGPSLARLGVTAPLLDPGLSLLRGDRLLATNDDWEISRNPGAIAEMAGRAGAFALAAGSLDSALLISLDPGAYTAVVAGTGSTTGVALIEIYVVD